MVRPREWTSAASFVPAGRHLPSSITGLAAQLGVALPGEEANTNPQFYAQLLGSREIQESVLRTRFPRPGIPADSLELIMLLGVSTSDSLLRIDRGLRRLGARVSASSDLKTGVVNLAVTMRDPDLSREVAERFLGLLNQFNLERRQSQAAAERAFAEQRLQEVQRALREAEDQLEAFLRRNRDARTAPELSFQQDRLARAVSLQQELYGTLAQAYEQAKLEEIRDTPVITILDHPGHPLRADSRHLALKILAAFLLGGMGGGLWVLFGLHLQDLSRESPGELELAEGLWKETLRDLRRPWVMFRKTRDNK